MSVSDLNVSNANAREDAPVAACLAETLAALRLEDPQLRATCVTFDDADHFRVGHERCTGKDLPGIFLDEQHLIEGELRPSVARRSVDFDKGAGRHLELVATGLNDRVHGRSSIEKAR